MEEETRLAVHEPLLENANSLSVYSLLLSDDCLIVAFHSKVYSTYFLASNKGLPAMSGQVVGSFDLYYILQRGQQMQQVLPYIRSGPNINQDSPHGVGAASSSRGAGCSYLTARNAGSDPGSGGNYGYSYQSAPGSEDSTFTAQLEWGPALSDLERRRRGLAELEKQERQLMADLRNLELRCQALNTELLDLKAMLSRDLTVEQRYRRRWDIPLELQKLQREIKSKRAGLGRVRRKIASLPPDGHLWSQPQS